MARLIHKKEHVSRLFHELKRYQCHCEKFDRRTRAEKHAVFVCEAESRSRLFTAEHVPLESKAISDIPLLCLPQSENRPHLLLQVERDYPIDIPWHSMELDWNVWNWACLIWLIPPRKLLLKSAMISRQRSVRSLKDDDDHINERIRAMPRSPTHPEDNHNISASEQALRKFLQSLDVVNASSVSSSKKNNEGSRRRLPIDPNPTILEPSCLLRSSPQSDIVLKTIL